MLHSHLALTQTAAEWHACLAESFEDLLDAVWRAEAGWHLDDRIDLAIGISPLHEPAPAPDHDDAAGAGSPHATHLPFFPPTAGRGHRGPVQSHLGKGGIPGHQPGKEA
jgi:hypothetical protein